MLVTHWYHSRNSPVEVSQLSDVIMCLTKAEFPPFKPQSLQLCSRTRILGFSKENFQPSYIQKRFEVGSLFLNRKVNEKIKECITFLKSFNCLNCFPVFTLASQVHRSDSTYIDLFFFSKTFTIQKPVCELLFIVRLIKYSNRVSCCSMLVYLCLFFPSVWILFK